jgi:hypothetical protein
MGRPCLLVEYSAAELTAVPNIIGSQLSQQGISYGHISHRGTEVSAWFVKAEQQANLRDTRITLLRLHAEHQALRRVARGLASQTLVPQPQSIEAIEMKDFISRALGHLTKPKRFGTSQQRFLELMNVYEQVAAHDDIPLVAGNLARFSSQVGLNLRKYLEDSSAGTTTAEGPKFEWQASPEQIEYHLGRLKAQFIDVKWLQSVLSKLAPAVCLIKVAKLGISATGFLIARDLVITNYHVLSSPEDSLLQPDVLRSVQLSFDSATSPNDLKIFTLAQDPVVWSSPISQLDCLLLRVSEDVTAAAAVQPIVANNGVMLEEGAGLHILQHPQGASLKLFTSPNSVTEVRPQSGLVRYLSLADHGSSGAPCFDDDQRLVAIHHAERGTPFGSVREGILFNNIYLQIQCYLS